MIPYHASFQFGLLHSPPELRIIIQVEVIVNTVAEGACIRTTTVRRGSSWAEETNDSGRTSTKANKGVTRTTGCGERAVTFS